MKTCFNLNFDSLGVNTFYLAERFMALSRKYGFKYTIFINGKDLKDKFARDRVREWSDDGHEIANHSYSHSMRFNKMNYPDARMEIALSHRGIKRACDKNPVGFTAPNWLPNPNQPYILRELGYKYDASIMPSPFLYLAHLKMRIARGTKLQSTLMYSFAPRTPHTGDGILQLPLPVSPCFRVPCWHTMNFMFPIEELLKSCFDLKHFYYLMHPADLMDSKDFPNQNVERLDMPVRDKTELLSKTIEYILSHTEETVTMEGIADEY